MEATLPKTATKYFWDTRVENLSVNRDRTYIIERLLNMGDLEELDWVNKNYSKEMIAQTVQNSRQLTPKTGNFFSMYYGIPKESLVCMKKRFI